MKRINFFRATALALIGLTLTQCKQEDLFYSNVLRSDVFFQAYDDHRYDFLWVFDNSGSMKSRRDFVKDNMQSFLNILNSRKAIDAWMAVTDTDMFTTGGALIKSPGGLEVVKSKETSNMVADMASIINNVQDSATSFWEQPLESAYQAINLHRAKFSRPGVPLIVVLLTDEQDWSCKDNCFGVEPENNTTWIAWPITRYIDFFKGVKKSENTDLHLFPIVGIDANLCNVASLGTRMMDIATALAELKTLSRSASICNSDLKASYEGIASVIADRGVKFKLSSKASGNGINVFIDQELVPFAPENYLYNKEENSIVFTGKIPGKGSIVEVTYSQETK